MPARTERSAPDHPAFTLAQLSIIVTWDGIRPYGLCARIVADHPDFLEVAEIVQGQPPRLRYLMHPTRHGTVLLSRSSGGEWELPSVERALTRLLMLEETDGQP